MMQAINSLLYIGYNLFHFDAISKMLLGVVSVLCVLYLVLLKLLEARLWGGNEDAQVVPIAPGAPPVSEAHVEDKAEVKEKYAKSGLQKERSDDLWAKLNQCLAEKKLYLKVDLDLNTLAAELDIRPQLLSQIINGNAGKSFYEFICEYRINEAIATLSMQKNAGRKLVDIAWSSGFSSHSAFFHHFKRRTGMTPRKFREMVLGEAALAAEDREHRCVEVK